ncbi:MAG: hypothetical protein A2X59_09975 [Nitrospirae bacterium GWC2_42_7]|nr:MAG: hypothetical protein A2X59_09975 [Nitrospirae bacterium GWC2_42_7]
MKRLFILSLTIVLLLFLVEITLATDSPHTDNINNPTTFLNVGCNKCHTLHSAPGTGLTLVAGNANLCMSCHNSSGGQANAKPFTSAENSNVIPGTSGRQHRWDGVMPASSSPSNTYGLRPVSELGSTLKSRLAGFSNVVVCSICHNQHSQVGAAWDPYSAGAYTGLRGGDAGYATSVGTTSTINDSTKSAYWTNNIWAGYSVMMTAGTAANRRQVRPISSNTATQITVSPAFPSATALNDRYEIIGRHFLRDNNDMNQLCEDCHYYRVQSHTTVEGPGDGIKVFSHPVGQALNANAKGYDRAAPLDANGSAQSGARFANGAETPSDNTTNNLVVESTTSKIRCLSCHRVHYTDSNGFAVHGP